MAFRLVFPLIALFWVIMNVLLWRAEYGSGREAGSPVPLEGVWHRILSAPDDSSLEISRNGTRIGHCRWVPSISQQAPGGESAHPDPDGMIQEVAGYGLEIDGNLILGYPPVRVRFHGTLQFGTNGHWRHLVVRISHRGDAWAVAASAVDERLVFKQEQDGAKDVRQLSFSEARNPRRLIQELAGPVLSGVLAPVMEGFKLDAAGTPDLNPVWDARNDVLRIGRSSVRVYRLRARLFDRHQVVVSISRVGEILLVELPDGIRLVNEALTTL